MAIARNGNDTVFTSNSGSTSISETYVSGSGSNRLIFIATAAQFGNPSTVTYNSVGGTVDKTAYDPGGSAGTTNFVSVGSLVAPATGSNTAAATRSASSSDSYYLACADYTGVKQSGQPDATASGTASSSTSLSYNITTVAANCWVMTVGWGTAGSLASGTRCTFFVNDGSRGVADTNASVGAAGTYSINFTAGSGRLFGASASYSPSVSANGNFFMFM